MRIGAMILLLALAACERAQPPGKRQGNLSARIDVPDFSFLEAQGRPLGRKDLVGKVWLCSFIFTHCPTACPPMAREMARIQDEFRDAKEFRIVSISVDPARDRPEVMREFLKSYGGKPDRWYFVTSKRPELQQFAASIGINNDPEDPLNHSVYFALVDKSAHVRDFYDQTDAGRMAQLRRDIRTLVAE